MFSLMSLFNLIWWTGVDCGQCATDFVESGGCDCLKQGDSCDVYSFVADECLVCEDDSENPCPSENGKS